MRSFEAFLEEVGVRPKGAVLDRQDNDKGYVPGNVRWVSRKKSAVNRSTSVLLTFKGKTRTMKDWSRAIGGSPNLVAERLKRGWSVKQALTTPAKR